jgi:hypothetical protein
MILFFTGNENERTACNVFISYVSGHEYIDVLYLIVIPHDVHIIHACSNVCVGSITSILF